MNELLMTLIKGEQVTEGMIAGELYEVCCRVHAGCTSECPVYQVNGGIPWGGGKKGGNCAYFKNGNAMLSFLRKAHGEGRL